MKMTSEFLHSFQSELLKTKRSLVVWMVVIGGFFTPSIIIVARLGKLSKAARYLLGGELLGTVVAEFVGIDGRFFPAAGSDIVDDTHRSDRIQEQYMEAAAHAAGFVHNHIFLKIGGDRHADAAVLYAFQRRNLPFRDRSVPAGKRNAISGRADAISILSARDALHFLDTLPILVLQYLISLRSKNFLVPVGLGFVFWVGAGRGIVLAFRVFDPIHISHVQLSQRRRKNQSNNARSQYPSRSPPHTLL